MNQDMLTRIKESSIVDLGFAYLNDAGLPILAWPLQTSEMNMGDWFGWIVRSVAGAPVCGRTEADCWRELARIDHVGLIRLLATIAPA